LSSAASGEVPAQSGASAPYTGGRKSMSVYKIEISQPGASR
jgi:hypothetical protein